MAKTPDLAVATDDDLTALNQRLGAQIDAIRDHRRAIVAELRRRHAARDAERIARGPRPGDAVATPR